jgi:hypothetical protein
MGATSEACLVYHEQEYIRYVDLFEIGTKDKATWILATIR